MSSENLLSSKRLWLELMSSNSEPKHVLHSTTSHEVLAHRSVTDEEKVEAASTCAWETVLDAGEHENTSCCHGRVEEQQGESGTVPEEANDSITMVLLEGISVEGKVRAKNALPAILDLFKDAREQLWRAETLKVKVEFVL